MFIKNVSDHRVDIRMKTRSLSLSPGDIQIITADEVRDPVLRDHLQVRSVAIVRPATAEEEEAFVNDTAS
jgi:hypothetical protein